VSYASEAFHFCDFSADAESVFRNSDFGTSLNPLSSTQEMKLAGSILSHTGKYWQVTMILAISE
jgi:hypothetical protein